MTPIKESDMQTAEFRDVDNFADLCRETHEWAKRKGWWPLKPDGTTDVDQRPYVEQWCNFMAEIAEAWEEYRAGRFDGWWTSGTAGPYGFYKQHDSMQAAMDSGQKPEGFWVEVADLVIRLADTCGAYGWTGKPRVSTNIAAPRSAGDFCAILWRDVLYSDPYKPSLLLLMSAVSAVFRGAASHGVDLWAVINWKRRYNETRSHRHGGKLA